MTFANLFRSDEAVDAWLETWSAGLAGLTGDQLRDGLGLCVERSPKWPPTLPEFRAFCLEAHKTKPPEHVAYLPSPRDTKDRTKELAEIMKILVGKQNG